MRRSRPGRGAEREAEKVRTRLLAQVDERRNPRTRATLDQLLDRWLDVVDLDATTRINYRSKLDKHVRPVLTHQQRRVALDPETVAVLQEHRSRAVERLTAVGLDLDADAYVFSPEPDGTGNSVPSR